MNADYRIIINKISFIETPPERPSDEELDTLCWQQGYAGQRDKTGR